MRLENILEIAESMDISREEITRAIQQKYSVYLKEGRCDNFAILQEMSGVEPEEEVVQEVYADCASKGSASGLKAWERVTGVPPKLSEDVIQKGYLKLLERGDDLLSYADDLERATKVKPSHAVVQEAYKNCIKKCRLSDFKTLKEKFQKTTGISPELSEEFVQEQYANYTKKGWLDESKKLQEMTKIEPKLSEDTIQEGYANYVRTSELYKLKELQKRTGVEPKLSEEVIQEGYKIYMSNSNVDLLKKLQELTSVQPQEKLVQEAYKKLFSKAKTNYDFRLFHLGSIRKLQEATGIRPKKKFVQEEYSYYTKKEDLEFVDYIQDITKIKPSEKIIQEAYLKYIKVGDYNAYGRNPRLYAVEKLQKITGIKPLDDNVQKGYTKFIKEENLEFIKELQEITGIKPSKDVYRAFIESL